MAMFVALVSSCSKKMGELSADYFTVTPQVLEAVGGKVPATINGKFPEKYFNKKAVVEVTPVLKWKGGEAKVSLLCSKARGWKETAVPSLIRWAATTL
ncbi:immunoreactive 53 kDa antigen PG123 [Bacteroides pyogenes JCM 10003]|nr:immunoreactive 53 kDa antigen PG123 [Bacteroides pyogenes JCM 10003]